MSTFDTPAVGTPRPDALSLALARLRADRLRFEGLPVATPLEIVRDAWERILLTDEVQGAAPGALDAFDGGVAFLLALVPGNQLLAGLEAKGLGYLLHALLAVATEKARRDQTTNTLPS